MPGDVATAKLSSAGKGDISHLDLLTAQSELQLTGNVIHLTSLAAITAPNRYFSFPFMHGGGGFLTPTYRPICTFTLQTLERVKPNYTQTKKNLGYVHETYLRRQSLKSSCQ
jgi:hypothetical protein